MYVKIFHLFNMFHSPLYGTPYPKKTPYNDAYYKSISIEYINILMNSKLLS